MRWLRRFRRAHHGVAYLVTGALVLMALLGLAATQVLPLAERHPDRIAGWLSDRAGRPVRFDAVDTRWTRRGPLLQLENLRIGAGDDAVMIGDAEMLVSQYSGLLPGRSFTELRVRNLDLTLERESGGRWRVRGLPGQQRPGGDPLASLQRLGELQVIGAKLHVIAPSLGLDTRVPQVHLRLRVEGDRVRAGVRAWMRPGGAPLDAVFDFDRKAGDGQAWIASRRTELAQWSPLLRYAGVSVEAGGGRAQAWAQLRAHRVVGVFADLALQRVELRGDAARPGAAAPRVRLDRVRGKLRWQTVDGGWRLDTPLLEFADGAGAPRLQRVTVAGGRRNVLLAARIDAAPLIAVTALSDRLAPGLRGWLQVARPEATLTDIHAVGVRGGALQVSGRLADAGFQPVAGAPGLRGLGGELLGDADALDFRFDPASAVTVNWPRGFGVAHRMSLRGNIVGWRDGTGWRAETPSLSVRGRNYGVDLRGGLWFEGDGTHPRIDLAADVGTAPVVAAKGFWVRNGMPAAAVRWLDSALLDGAVQGGRALVSGDLDDWPFRSRDGQPANGVFHATARIRDGVVKFQSGWPAVEHMDAEVDFIADGFRVRGQRASIAGVPIGGFEAGIERFGRAVLSVDANAATDASRLLDLLRQSPLRETHGETLANIGAKGPARVEFGLQLPLHRGAPPSAMQGTVALQRAQLSDKRWDLAFTDVSGSARYGRGGFDADKLAVVHQGRPGRLSLRAGDYVRDARQVFEAELDAQLRAEDLLERAPDLRWLRPKVSGSSAWTLAVAVPKTGAAAAEPSRLQLRSNLIGTALALPAPLDKPASVALPTTVDVALPLGEGEVAVAFGNRLALRARSRGGQTGVRVALGASRVDAAPPPSGLVATGRSDRLDVIDWAALTRGGDTAPGQSATSASTNQGVPLRSVDVTVAGLQLIGASFPNTRLRAVPAAGGTAVRLDGAALSGAFMLPQSGAAAIAGRFERLHWRAANKAVTGAAAATEPSMPNERAPAVDDTDPSRVPPLILAIDDLRFGDARLGTASLRTQPVAAGMRIVQLQTRAKGQSIDISGDWLRRAGNVQTRLDGRWKSDDFGAMLGAFDFRQISKGKGEARLQAQWPGSPATFRLADLAGDMHLDVRDGQLVEVEPGAGRVLGLLSIAQLPRRLAFDFRDFFDKGFAFNKISGQVQFGGGNARSNDLIIDGPAAEIRIRGAADLRAQTYDQTIDVFPRAGNLLTVAGAIAGGPVGAAIGAAANAVLNKPLGQLAAKTYRVTGPWKDPKVETISRGNAAAAAKEPPG